MAVSNYDDVVHQLTSFGLVLDHSGLQVGSSRTIRCHVQDGGREKRGWYRLHEFAKSDGDILIVGTYGVWRGNDPNTQKVTFSKKDPLSAEQAAALKKRLAEDRKRIERERKAEGERAARKAGQVWARLSDDGDSPYLKAKHVGGVGLRYTKHDTAVLPLVDTAGRVHGLQFLRTAAQAKEGKRPAKELWPAGMAMKGHFHLLGHSPHWLVLVAEGYATAASLHAATGYPVACAISANNLMPVAEALRRRYKQARILVCADDDCFTEGNPGVDAASAAAIAVDGAWLKPVFEDEAGRQAKHAANGHKLTDFNDLHVLEGLPPVRAQVEARLTELKWEPPKVRAASSSTTGGGAERLRPLQWTQQLLDRYALVYASGGAVFDRQEHCLLPLTDMRNACIRADLHKSWMEHPDRDIVRQDEVGFDPAEDDPKVTCNLWGGWPTEPKAGKCERLLDLLRYMCSGEGNSSDLYNWVLKWVAYPIQHPGAKMKTTVVVHGPQGTGKNLFFESVMAIYGKYGRILDQDALTDKHNDWASRKLFLIADEVVAQAHRFEVKNKLKTLITGTWVRINPKHIAAYDEANHVNLVFLSNESMPVVLEEDDRRHCVIWTPPKKDKAYYAELLAEINNGGIEALHDYLLHLDLGDFGPGSLPPDTAAKRELIDLAQDSPVEFFDALIARDLPTMLVDEGAGLNPRPGLATDWFTVYGRWCGTVGVKPASMKRFINALARKRQIHAVRKRYLVWNGYEADPERLGPHSVLLFGMAPPEGEEETAWLGKHIAKLRDRIDSQRGAK